MNTQEELHRWTVVGRRKGWGVDAATIIATTIDEAITIYRDADKFPSIDIWSATRNARVLPSENLTPGREKQS